MENGGHNEEAGYSEERYRPGLHDLQRPSRDGGGQNGDGGQQDQPFVRLRVAPVPDPSPGQHREDQHVSEGHRQESQLVRAK